ncbi:insulinase family protein [Candidatus Acetothermia bacterium]|nr:insulinase family protein [Candidatus Acetothermia bacterium]
MKITQFLKKSPALTLVLLLAVLQADAQVKVPPIRTEALTNGVRVMMLEQHQLPMVYMALMVRAGSGFDPDGKEGLARFTAEMLTQGTKNRTADKIAEEIDSIGGELDAQAQIERTIISARVLKKDFKTGLRLLGDVVRNAIFPDAEMEIVRNQLLGQISAVRDNPGALLQQHLLYSLFTSEHPLGSFMSMDSLKSITKDDLQQFYSKYYLPNGAILVVAGDINPSDVMNEVQTAFINWAPGAKATNLPAIAPPPPPNGYQVRFVQKAGQTQVQIGLAESGITFKDSDYLPAQLANYILGGGGFSSRLLKVVRSQEGKTYSISSRFIPYKFPGVFEITTFSRNEEALATLELVIRELKKFREGGITPDELNKAKGAIAGRHILRFETLPGFAQTVLDQEFYERGKDWLSKFPDQVMLVKLDDVNKAIQSHFDPDNITIVLLGDRNIFEGHETILGNIPTGEIGVVNWNQPLTTTTRPLRLLTQKTNAANCAPQICASMDDKTRTIVQAWVQAQGGLEAISKINDRTAHWTGQMNFNRQLSHATITERWQNPNKFEFAVEVSNFQYAQVVNGEEGWTKVQNRSRDLNAENLLELGSELFFFQSEFLPKILSNPNYRLTSAGTATIEKTTTAVIEVRSATSHPYKFYLDQTTHRLVKLELVNEKQEYFYTDYKQVGNIWSASHVRVVIEGKLDSDLTLQNVQYNQGIDPKTFERPK